MGTAPQSIAKDIVWQEDENQELVAFVHGKKATWAPMPGSQEAFLTCPVFEVLLHGSRGGGKTDTLLMDFAQHVGQGFGAEWRGIIFRRTYPELQDLISKCKKWFPQIWPTSKCHETRSQWEWETGEKLLFRHADVPADYYKYHGSAFPWIAFEELTTWESPHLYLACQSLCRSTIKRMPRKYRATTNPSGIGHNWVRSRFKLPSPQESIIGPILTDENTQQRVAITSSLFENKVLLHADPGYVHRLATSAPNPAILRAWVNGDWTVVAGGMLDDLWMPSVHVIPNIPTSQIPRGWRIDRAFDYGQSRPFFVGWFAESDGTPISLLKQTLDVHGPSTQTVTVGQIPGDTVLLREWYGSNGEPNVGLNMEAHKIAEGIRNRQREWGIDGRVRPGPADNSIYDIIPGKGSVASDMSRPPNNVRWLRSDKGAGSRVQGWAKIRSYLSSATETPRKLPGLFVCEDCIEFIRTVPTLPRDAKRPDDVDTRADDHAGDTLRYRLRRKSADIIQSSF